MDPSALTEGLRLGDLRPLAPLLALSGAVVAALLAIAARRSHALVWGVTLAGLVATLASLTYAAQAAPAQVTLLVAVDAHALFYTGLVAASALCVTLISRPYLERRSTKPEEYYVLLLLATLGAALMTGATHFASFLLGLETLSVALYGLIGYLREERRSIEAGLKYLVLAGMSSAFLVFGMALVYSELGIMDFPGMAALMTRGNLGTPVVYAGLAMLVVGVGFKLAVVPFHMWTPDVYVGAPAPVTAFVATASKGAVVALLLRLLTALDGAWQAELYGVLAVIAIASMLVGNLLALFQTNVKRILAYSSIAHLGYVMVAIIAGGERALEAAGFYILAYSVTTLASFGVVSVLSEREREAERIEDYQSLAWRRPWLAAVFTLSLLSLAGLPLTAGFVAKFQVLAAGVGARLWLPVVTLAVASAIGVFYYLRIVLAIIAPVGTKPATAAPARLPLGAALVLSALGLILLWLGVFPSSVQELIKATATRLL